MFCAPQPNMSSLLIFLFRSPVYGTIDPGTVGYRSGAGGGGGW
jgi:hypothetical protein